jgi:hypothetical protein
MSEIVERLRKHWSHGLPLNDIYPTCKEAADEIERLTRELAEAKAVNLDNHNIGQAAYRAAIEAAAKVARDWELVERRTNDAEDIYAAIRALVKP